MKTCPTCSRTFEDTFTFCLADGSLLDAPFDPQATLIIPEPRQTEPQPEQRLNESGSTMSAPAPTFESPQIEEAPAGPARKSNRLLLMIGVLATSLIIGVAVFILANRADNSRQNPVNENGATVDKAATDPANATNSNSVNAEISSGAETTSSNQSAIINEDVGGEPIPTPFPSSTKKAPSVPSPTGHTGRKGNPIEAKTPKPDVDASTAPCANKSYPVCEPDERLGCNAAKGVWECRRLRKKV